MAKETDWRIVLLALLCFTAGYSIAMIRHAPSLPLYSIYQLEVIQGRLDTLEEEIKELLD